MKALLLLSQHPVRPCRLHSIPINIYVVFSHLRTKVKEPSTQITAVARTPVPYGWMNTSCHLFRRLFWYRWKYCVSRETGGRLWSKTDTWTRWFRDEHLPGWWGRRCSRNRVAFEAPCRRGTDTSKPKFQSSDCRTVPDRRLPAGCRKHACDWGKANRQLRTHTHTHQNIVLHISPLCATKQDLRIRMTVAGDLEN